MRIDKEAMIQVLHEKPAFAELFTAYLLAHTIRIEEDLALTGHSKQSRKVIQPERHPIATFSELILEEDITCFPQTFSFVRRTGGLGMVERNCLMNLNFPVTGQVEDYSGYRWPSFTLRRP